MAHEHDFTSETLAGLVEKVDGHIAQISFLEGLHNTVLVWIRLDPAIWSGEWRTILAFSPDVSVGLQSSISTSFATYGGLYELLEETP